MTHFLVFDKKELQDLNNNKPVMIDINGAEYVVCSEEYFKEQNNPFCANHFKGDTNGIQD